MKPLVAAVAFIMVLGACTDVLERPFGLEDLERLRQPSISALSPDGGWISYVLGDTLWLKPATAGGESLAVSAGMSNQIAFDYPFLAWSSDGAQLLYRTGTGGPAGQGTPMVYDVAQATNTPLLPDSLANKLQSFLHWAASGPTWSANGGKVALTAVDRTGHFSRHLGLYVVDIRTSAVTLVATDSSGSLGGVASAAWSPDGRWLAYGTGSFAGTAGRLLLRRADGGGLRDDSVRVLREGGAPMYRLLSWSPDGQFLSVLPHGGQRFLLEIDESGRAGVVSEVVPFDNHLWTTDGRLIGVEARGMSAVPVVWSPGEARPVPLTEDDALVQIVGVASRSDETTVVAYTEETGQLPVDVWTAELPHNAESLAARTRITHANPWLDSIAVARANVVRWVGPAGDSLDALLFIPSEGIADPPYPLLVQPYGGFRNSFPKSEYFLEAGIQLLASDGWAIAQPNTRGMASQPLTGRYGEVQLDDTRALIDTLSAQGLIDAARVAVMGHSHGGALAYYYLTHHDGFCAVVAVNGWSDWSQISGRLQAPEDQLNEKLQRFSPILNAERVDAPLLAVSGAGDTQVLPENASRMVDALRGLGKQAELLHFEDEGHLLTKDDNRRLFWTRVPEFLRASCDPSARRE